MRRRNAAAKYRDKATVEKLVTSPTTDPLGPEKLEAPANWETYATIYVEETVTGTKPISTGHGSAELRYELKTPYSSEAEAIGPTYRLNMEDGRVLNVIAAYRETNERREITIQATQVV